MSASGRRLQVAVGRLVAACCRMRVQEPVTRLVLVQMGKTDPSETFASGRFRVFSYPAADVHRRYRTATAACES
jgi:hypothetical protein